MNSGYRAKFDWVVLKPFWLLFIISGLYYLIHAEWFLGIAMIIIDFLIGMIASSLHSNFSKSELFSGKPHISLLFQQEDDILGGEDSRIIGKAMVKLAIVFGIASLILLVHYDFAWYYSVLISLVAGWIILVPFLLIYGLLLKIRGVRGVGNHFIPQLNS